MHLLPQRRVVFTHPTNDNLLAVFVGWPVEEFGLVRSSVEQSFLDALDLAPGLSWRIRSGRRVERFFGTADLPNFFRKSQGPGWALVGDAASHKDPIQARGIHDALLEAELLANAVHAGLAGAQALDAALAEYQVLFEEAIMPGYRENLESARLRPIPPDLLRLRSALRDKPLDTKRYFLALYDRIAFDDFFNQANLERILGSAQAAAASCWEGAPSCPSGTNGCQQPGHSSAGRYAEGLAD
jgi:flavin-dependent dehydrogenase